MDDIPFVYHFEYLGKATQNIQSTLLRYTFFQAVLKISTVQVLHY